MMLMLIYCFSKSSSFSSSVSRLSKLSSKSLREQIQRRPSERELFLLFLLEIRKREVSREHFLLFKIRESRPAQNEGETDERVPVLQNASRPRTGKPRRGPSVRRHRFHVVEVTVRVFTATFFPNLSLLFDRSVARKRWSQILASVLFLFLLLLRTSSSCLRALRSSRSIDANSSST